MKVDTTSKVVSRAHETLLSNRGDAVKFIKII